VFDGNREHALGIVQAKDLLDVYLSGRTPDIRALTRDAPIIPKPSTRAMWSRSCVTPRAYRAGA